MTYWDERNSLKYYGVVRDLLDKLGPGELLLDVGCNDTPMVQHGTFARRITVDIQPRPKLVDVEAIVADWMYLRWPHIADVVMCLQTLEHLADGVVQEFAHKLRVSGRTMLISVPYMWHKWSCVHHKQDPIDLDKLDGFMGCKSITAEIVTEDCGISRLVAVYPGLCTDANMQSLRHGS